MRSDWILRCAAAVLITMVATAILAPLLATDKALIARTGEGIRVLPDEAPERVVIGAPVPHSPDSVDLGRRLEAPSARHLLGTDELGRDVLSRIIHGGRVSLVIGIGAGLLAFAVGAILGLAAGWYGGVVDWLVLRLIELALCFPFYFVALAVLVVFDPSITSLLVALTITSWTGEARLVRGETLRLRSGTLVEAAISTGAGRLRVMYRHLLPNAVTPAVVSAGFGVAAAILGESALSFLGFGVPLPTASWGGMLSTADDHLLTAWWLALFPGAAIVLTTASIQVVTERFRRRLAVESSPVPIR